jgi:hypothetical protein
MSNDGEVRIQKSICTILSTGFFRLVQLSASNWTGYALFPADVGQGMYSFTIASVNENKHHEIVKRLDT